MICREAVAFQTFVTCHVLSDRSVIPLGGAASTQTALESSSLDTVYVQLCGIAGLELPFPVTYVQHQPLSCMGGDIKLSRPCPKQSRRPCR